MCRFYRPEHLASWHLVMATLPTLDGGGTQKALYPQRLMVLQERLLVYFLLESLKIHSKKKWNMKSHSLVPSINMSCCQVSPETALQPAFTQDPTRGPTPSTVSFETLTSSTLSTPQDSRVTMESLYFLWNFSFFSL